jgi:hypothetical protein
MVSEEKALALFAKTRLMYRNKRAAHGLRWVHSITSKARSRIGRFAGLSLVRLRPE